MRFDADVVEGEQALDRAGLAPHLDRAFERVARAVRRHQKGADPASALCRQFGIGDGEDCRIIGVDAVRDPDLVAGQAPATAVGHRARADHRGVRSGLGFGQGEAHRLVARHDPRQHFGLHLGGRTGEQRARPLRPMADDIIGQPVARPAGAGDMFPGAEIRQQAEATAADRLRHAHGVEAGSGRGAAYVANDCPHLGTEPAVRSVATLLVIEQVGMLLMTWQDLDADEAVERLDQGLDHLGQGRCQCSHRTSPPKSRRISATQADRAVPLPLRYCGHADQCQSLGPAGTFAKRRSRYFLGARPSDSWWGDLSRANIMR